MSEAGLLSVKVCSFPPCFAKRKEAEDTSNLTLPTGLRLVSCSSLHRVFRQKVEHKRQKIQPPEEAVLSKQTCQGKVLLQLELDPVEPLALRRDFLHIKERPTKLTQLSPLWLSINVNRCQ